MFSLDEAILRWRQRMTAGGVKAPEVLEELESHLRDEVKERMGSGLSLEQAFEAAVQQMGHPSVLTSEFEKVGGASQRLRRAQKDILCFIIVGFFALVSGHTFLKVEMSLAAGILGFFAVALILFSVWRGRREAGLLAEVRFSNLTPTARQTLDLARQEAPRLHHNFVGTEHLLLGLTELEEGIVPNIMQKLGVSRESVRREVEEFVSGFAAQEVIANIPYTPRARKALLLAGQEAKAMNRTCLGSEHLLLGLLREGDGVAARVLKKLGVQTQRTRKAILEASALG